ncbi:MAG: hypothetical protein ABR573_11960 [Candidatus Dormibacteria bacterium]
MSQAVVAVAAAGLSVLFAGCGSAGMQGPPNPTADHAGAGSGAACALFTDAEIGAAAGRTFTKHDGADATLIGQSVCTYQGSDPSGGLQTYIFYNTKAMETYQLNESGAEHIPGLGDDAFWTRTLQSLFVRKGTHALYIVDIGSVSLDGSADSSHKDAFVALASKALPKI